MKNYVNRNLVLTNVCLARAKSRLIYFVIDKFKNFVIGRLFKLYNFSFNCLFIKSISSSKKTPSSFTLLIKLNMF